MKTMKYKERFNLVFKSDFIYIKIWISGHRLTHAPQFSGAPYSPNTQHSLRPLQASSWERLLQSPQVGKRR